MNKFASNRENINFRLSDWIMGFQKLAKLTVSK